MIDDISNSFAKYFRLVPATTPELRAEVFKLRYQVYCQETRFENPEEFPNEQEHDEYDGHSDYFLVQHLRTGEYAATTRVILPVADDPHYQFPIERHCQIDRTDLVKPIARNRICEASRFCVSKTFKHRHAEMGTLAGISDESIEEPHTLDERRTFPHITLALFAGLVRLSAKHHITHWYAVMEPALIRFFDHLGIGFIPIGPLTEYHGKRKPCIIAVEDLLVGAKAKDEKVWHLFTDGGKISPPWESL
ncbi:MAG: PEP-CTERM/exosortase system-associated acyltransferase [Methylococcaceae bacterium]|nr:PEP-CTERM/exosortase system-associated acyltransferase [Methylococcaceae bacterium]